MRVLYADHSIRVSGAQRSLIDLIEALDGEVEPVLAVPDGQLADEVAEAGWVRVAAPATTASLRLHPRHTARGLATLAGTARVLRGQARAMGCDLVHANTIQASLAAALARRAGAPPVVAHVRDSLPPGAATAAVRRFVSGSTDAVVANSAFTARSFGGGTTVIPPSLDPQRFDPDRVEGSAVRSQLGLGDDDCVLVVLAQITPWKGQADAIKILARVRRARPDVHLVIAGEVKFDFEATRYDNVVYRNRLDGIVADHGLGGHVHFIGERPDVERVLAATDLLLVPSWEEPFGRSVIEASAMAVPVLATNCGGPTEIIRDGETGRLLPPRDHDAWASAVVALLGDAGARHRLGAAARRDVVRRYDRAAISRQMLALYGRVAAL